MGSPSKPWGKGRRVQHVRAGDGVGDTSLVGAWNMRPVGGVIVDESGNGNDGTIVGSPTAMQTLLGTGLWYDDAADYVNIGNPANGAVDMGTDDFTLACWVRGLGSTDFGALFRKIGVDPRYYFYISDTGFLRALVDDSVHLAYADTAVIPCIESKLTRVVAAFDRSEADGITIYVDGVDATDSRTGSLAAVGDIDNGNDLHIGGPASQWLIGTIIAPKIYKGKAFTAAQALADYQDGARAIQGKSDYGVNASVANETAGTLGENSSPVEISSGTWQITEEVIGGQNCKVIECIAAGVCYIPRSVFEATPTEMAYGSWEFWLYRVGGGGDNPRGSFISPDETATPAGGYRWDFSDASSLIVENGVGVTITGAAVTASVWHQIKITRASDGDFGFYADGASLGTGNDTTITTGEYMTFDMDAGDKIAYADQRGDHSLIKQLGVVAP